jgi:acetyltransferase-like isoleucine patch superfamily enzyme
MLLKLLSLLLPWPLRYRALKRWFGFDLHPTARIGWAWVFPRRLIMGPNTYIDHLTVAINLDLVHLSTGAIIGRSNWITGFPTNTDSRHFQHQKPERRAELWMGEYAAVTKNHHLDCTNRIEIGAFATVAGYNSQLLTHSIDVFESRQDSAPITIGAYTFLGTNIVILGGSTLPSHSVLGAKSLLNKVYTDEWMLYAGVPARPVSPIAPTAKYFTRKKGFVY